MGLSNMCVFCIGQKSKIVTTTGHSIKIGPYGKMKKISQEICIKYFPHMLNLLCGGGHLGFSIDKNINFVQYHPIIIHVPSNL
jgi:hypothetical protein